jgi:hypothetical protein
VHANALLTGSMSIVLADLRDPAAIVAHPKVGSMIDSTEPIALLLVAILHFIADAEVRLPLRPRCGTRSRLGN